MSLDGVLALVGIIIAAYQIMARSRRLDFRLRFGFVAWVVVVAASATILYIHFYSVFATFGLTPQLNLWRRNITPERATVIVVLLTLTFLMLYFHTSRLSPRRLASFRQLIEELISSDRHSELISLVDRHLDRLNRIATGNLFLSRLRSRLTDQKLPKIDLAEVMERLRHQTPGATSDSQPQRMQQVRRFLRYALRTARDWTRRSFASLLPTYDNSRSMAAQTLRFLLSSRSFACAVADLRPYFAPRILDLNDHEVFTFQDNYFRALLGRPGSTLFVETWACSQTSAFGLHIPPSCQLLRYLFHDARIAERLSTYKPVGEAMLSDLASFARNPTEDQYNLASDNEFGERGQRDSSLHAGVLFFDIMIMSALHQGITWHMWLYYFSRITEAVVRNHRPQDPLLEPLAEYPTRYDHLLYEMFSSMKRWVLAAKELPEDQENVRVCREDTELENGNIPKSTVLAMSESLRHVLLSRTIFPQTKSSLIGLMLDLYFELGASSYTAKLAKVLLIALSQGGSWQREDDTAYRSELLEGASSFDWIPYPDGLVSELRRTLRIGA